MDGLDKTLPTSTPDENSMFGVDKNININTIDAWLGRVDVVYRDLRMLMDPVEYCRIGGDPVLSGTIEDFEVVPYPYLANLSGLPKELSDDKYTGTTLFTLTWDASGTISTLERNYYESELIIGDLFPQDKAIFLMCGGGGYAAFTKALLIKLGYDAKRLYNIGAFWEYNGNFLKQVRVSYGQRNWYYAFHRLKYHLIDFEQLHRIPR